MRVLSTYLVAVLLPLALFGLHVEVRPGAVPSCISTEVSTNIPFNAVRSDVLTDKTLNCLKEIAAQPAE